MVVAHHITDYAAIGNNGQLGGVCLAALRGQVIGATACNRGRRRRGAAQQAGARQRRQNTAQ